MADVQGTNYAIARTGGAYERVGAADYRGEKRVMNDSYEAASTAADTDVIVGNLSSTAKVQIGTRVMFDAMGAGVTIGLALRAADGTTTAVFAAADASSAGEIAVVAANIDVFPVQAVDASGDPAACDIIIQIKGAIATGTIKSFVEYAE